MANKKINYGEYAFLGGIILSVILGVLASFVPTGLLPILFGLLFILGIVVGLVNISEKEVNSFLMATIALLIAATSWNSMLGVTLGLFGDFGSAMTGMVTGFTSMLVAFVSPAAFIVALKAVYKLAQPD